MRRVVLTMAVLAAVVACTPRERALWHQWHAQDPEAAVAFAVALDAETPDPVVDAPSSRWDRIARCESGGRWDYPIVTNRTGSYSGGLMIWNDAWIAYGGREFAQWAYLASRSDQIIVAERILADQGWGAWDCA